MITLSRSLVSLVIPFILISATLLAAQAQNQESDRELQAGKEALTKGQYDDALAHFTRANLLRAMGDVFQAWRALPKAAAGGAIHGCAGNATAPTC